MSWGPGLETRLGPAQRAESVRRLSTDSFDVLVIGGGVTGCGIALDAAARGLRVALAEQGDLAEGTSSRSSKLIHGGLRYLESKQFDLVREALRERRLLLDKLAPHLVKRIPFLFPLHRKVWERAYVGSGVFLYDALAGKKAALPRHRHLTRSSCLKLVPALAGDSLTGGIRYYDAQVDDARYVVTLARTAAAYGARIVTRLRVDDLLTEGGRVTGAKVSDLAGGASFSIRATVTINATGVWATSIERMAGAAGPLQVRASKGVHILVPRDRIASRAALVVRTEESVLFVLPWDSHWLIGTTDTEWTLSPGHPTASRADIDYLLRHVNALLRTPLRHRDIVGVYAGLRPLVDLTGRHDGQHHTAQLSREHVVRRSRPGLVTVAGGKYTTYRLMAADAVDTAVADLPFSADTSRTADIPLLGAIGLASAPARCHERPGAATLDDATLAHLVGRYGSLATGVLDLVAADPSLAAPLPGAGRYLAAEAAYAVRCEGALHIEDVLTRRTHVAIEAGDHGLAAAEPVARIMARVLGWDAATTRTEVATYHDRVAAETASLGQPDLIAS
ncbi:MAG: glycerol-3-phosphate dehydrogenase/oxidase [Nocardiopsaceae bacterium]|jgi:glycerol-3-phosphate dehydrogenase|nr:glycerol-3-phosphate dehydrogenase/oxidase [Nocardiopsaceae bacterium]